MGVAVNIISAVLKSVVGDKIGNELTNEVIGISIDGVSEKGIDRISDFINGEKAKIENIISKENMKSIGISEESIDYVVAEIKDLLLKVEITDEVLRQCKYDSMNLSIFLWTEYCKQKNSHIECESDIKKGLLAVSKALVKLMRESEAFEKEVLIQISSSVVDVNTEIQEVSIFLKKEFNKLDNNNQRILNILRMLLKQTQNLNEQMITKSRTQEYADKWNENMFLNDFDERDERQGTNVKLSSVYKEEHLPPYIWKDNKERENLDLKNLLSEYMYGHYDNKMLLILGQPGIGKSTLITWITANLAKRTRNILVYCFASDLKEIDWKSGQLSKIMLKELNLSNKELNETVLILDGFDEINIEGDRGDVLNKLYWELIKEKRIYKFSLIVTCRENYIENLHRIRCEYITLQRWNKKQIQSFCKIYQEQISPKRITIVIDKILKNQEILGIPLILYMVLALDIHIEMDSSVVGIYDKIFSLEGGIYDRCVDNKSFANKHRISKIKQQIHQVSREIAMWMFENASDEACIPQKEYKKICFDIIQKDEKVGNDFDNDVLIGNYFKQVVKHLDMIEMVGVSFVHRSIYEYFLVEYIFTLISNKIYKSKEDLAALFGMVLKKGRLSYQMLEFLKVKILKSKICNKQEVINSTFELMLEEGMTYCTGICYKNAIECEMNIFINMLALVHLWEDNCMSYNVFIANYLKRNIEDKLNLKGDRFKGVDLNESYLSEANLCNSEFIRTTMLGANLRKVKLVKASLYEVNLINADLIGADLVNITLVNSSLVNANLSLANLNGATITKSNLTNVNLNGSTLISVDLCDSSFLNVDIENATLRYVKLVGTDLTGTDLQKAKIFENIDLRDAILDESQVDYLSHKCNLLSSKVRLSKGEKIVSYKEYYNTKSSIN